jgi:dTDP-glucose pyrophosphorylase
MKIIITMAGEGSRFKKVGYKAPKHEIEVKGKSLFEWSMLSLKNFFDENFIFIVRENNYDKEKLECLCNKLGIKNFKLKEIKELTDGQASTAYLCNEYISEDEDVLIYNIDTYISGDEIKKEELKKYDGYIPVFKSEGDKWSFIKLDDNGKVIDVVEKIRVSDLGSIGLYYFKVWRDYKEIYLKYKEEIKRKYKEVYIAPMYHYLMKKEKNIGYIILRNEDIHVLGTPEDLNNFKGE